MNIQFVRIKKKGVFNKVCWLYFAMKGYKVILQFLEVLVIYYGLHGPGNATVHLELWMHQTKLKFVFYLLEPSQEFQKQCICAKVCWCHFATKG